MTVSLRNTLAWLRGRWHADLEFQHRSQRDVLLDRLQAVLAGQELQASRIDQISHRLAATESGLEALNADQAARFCGLREDVLSTSRELAAVHTSTIDMRAFVHATATDLRYCLSATCRDASEQISAISAGEPRTREAIAEIMRALREAETHREERAAITARQAMEFAAALSSLDQSIQVTAQALPALSQEFRAEQQRSAEGFARLEQTIQRNRDLERDWAERAERARREEAAVAARRINLSSDDLAAIERQGVFVVGSARSGTTILSDCFNVARDVYMLQEACFFCSDLAAKFVGWDKYDFAAAFNERHVSYGNPRDKGTYVPTAAAPDRTPLEFVNRLRAKYRYIGEKLAFGPEPHYMGERWESDFLAYHARYFYHSQYFITIRAPHEALWSMHKMFPDRPIAGLFEAWLRTLRTTLDLYLAFPNTHLFVMEWLDERLIGRIGEVLQTEIPLPAGMLGRAYQTSALGKNELVPVLQPYRPWHDECAAFYREVRESFSRDTLQFSDPAHQRRFVNDLGKRATSLLGEVLRALQTKSLSKRKAA